MKRIHVLLILTALVLSAITCFNVSGASKADFYKGNIYIDKSLLYGINEKSSVSSFKSQLLKNATILDKAGKEVSDADYIGSGFTLKLEDESSYDFIVLGDTDGDGIIRTADYLAIKRHMIRSYILSEIGLKAADVSPDGNVTNTDYLTIKKYLQRRATIQYKAPSIPEESTTTEASVVTTTTTAQSQTTTTTAKTTVETKQATTTTAPTPSTTVDPDWVNQGEILLSASNIKTSGDGISVSGNVVNITAGGEFKVTGTSPNVMICVNSTEKVKLRLAGASLTNPTGPAIFFMASKKSYITISEGTENYLIDGSTYSVDAKAALFSEDDLEIKGNGTLYITGNFKHGICCDDDLTIENGNIIIKSAATDGIHANNSIIISGGAIEVQSCGSDAIEAAGNKSGLKGFITISAGTLTLNSENGAAVKSLSELTITGGTINVLKAKDGIRATGAIAISGGKTTVNAVQDAIKSTVTITISAVADITIHSENDGIDAINEVAISGGTVRVNAVDKTLTSDGVINITGGAINLEGGKSKIYAGTSLNIASNVKIKSI